MNKEVKLKEEFDGFIEKMIGEWQENANNAKAYQDDEVVKIENIKMNIARVIKTVYKVKYKEVYGASNGKK